MSVDFINGLMTGKNYSHAINSHKIMTKKLNLNRYLETMCSIDLPSDLLQAIDHIINERTSENLDAAMQNKALPNFLKEYSAFTTQVCEEA